MADRSKMVLEVWSDIVCPYCYMGKRMLQAALAEFARRDEVKVVWKSYQLDPSLRAETSMDVYEYLGRKGFDRQAIAKAHEELKQKGTRQGVVFNFETTVISNTFDAHRLMHFAVEADKHAELQEALFRAHFTDGRNVGDIATLREIAAATGLDKREVDRVLLTDAYADAVRADIDEARDLGIEAVPHFMFNREHEVIGAEGAERLLQTLVTAFGEWEAAAG